MSEVLSDGVALNINREERNYVSNFMSTPIDDKVPFSNLSLLPTFALHADQEAARIVSQSVENVNRKRKFDKHEDFQREILKELPAAFQSGEYDRVLRLVRYIFFINKLHTDRGWQAANAYHWRLMTKCSDGEWSFSNGHYDPECYEAIKDKFKAAPSKKNQQQRKDKRFKECSYHGWCDHVTAACKSIEEDPTLAGKRALNYRSRR